MGFLDGGILLHDHGGREGANELIEFGLGGNECSVSFSGGALFKEVGFAPGCLVSAKSENFTKIQRAVVHPEVTKVAFEVVIGITAESQRSGFLSRSGIAVGIVEDF